jgi:hypothetical protein
MALSPNVVVVAAGDLITSAHVNNIRSNLDRLDVNKFNITGGAVTGNITTTGFVQVAGNPLTPAAGVRLWETGKAAIGSDTVGAGLILQRHGSAYLAGQEYVRFSGGSGQSVLGTITMPNGTSVAYNETSDERLKDVIGPVVDPVGRVLALRPILFAWKDGGAQQDGFLAHEVQAVAPYAVTGERGAVLPDDDPQDPGGIDPQQLDAAKLVPLLVAAVQALTARIDALEGV